MNAETGILEQLGAGADAMGGVVIPGGATAALGVLFGPSVLEVGQVLREFTGYRLRNILGIGEKIHSRIGDEPTTGDEKVHPRVAKALIEEGSWIDDDVAQEYFAGIMLSARHTDGKEADDAYYGRLAASLGPDHIRLHHLAYSSLVGLGPAHSLATSSGAAMLGVYIPFEDIEPHVTIRRVATAAGILSREELIGEFAVDPSGEVLKTLIPWAPGRGFGFKPTSVGTQLFLRAYGIDRPSADTLLKLAAMPSTKTQMPVAANAIHAPGVARVIT